MYCFYWIMLIKYSWINLSHAMYNISHAWVCCFWHGPLATSCLSILSTVQSAMLRILCPCTPHMVLLKCWAGFIFCLYSWKCLNLENCFSNIFLGVLIALVLNNPCILGFIMFSDHDPCSGSGNASSMINMINSWRSLHFSLWFILYSLTKRVIGYTVLF